MLRHNLRSRLGCMCRRALTYLRLQLPKNGGRKILKRETPVIDLTHLQSGMYFLQVSSDSKITTHRIVKQN